MLTRIDHNVPNSCSYYKELKRTGKGDVDHHEPLTDLDLQKCYRYLAGKAPKSAVTLQEKVTTEKQINSS